MGFKYFTWKVVDFRVAGLDLGVAGVVGTEVTLKTIGGNGVGKKPAESPPLFFPPRLRWLMIGRALE